jgi:hypothetical protein
MKAGRSLALLAAVVALSAAIALSGTARPAAAGELSDEADGLFGTILPNGER